MNNFIFIPDNKSLIISNGLRKGTIHYKFNASPYQTISWSENQEIYSLLNLNKTPEENIIKECIIVFTNREIAVGLKVIDENIFTVFKSTKLNEIKAICKKYSVKTDFDNELALDLFRNSYLNEIPPLYLLESIARKFIRIYEKDKIFAKKLSHYFTISLYDTVNTV